MKVAIIYSHLKEIGGVENVILKQAELFQDRGYDVKCCFAYVSKQLPTHIANPNQHIKSYFGPLIPNNEPMRIILSIPLAPLTLKFFRDDDVLLCHGCGPAPWVGYNLKRIRGTNYISYIHCPPRFLYLDPEMKRLWKFNTTRNLTYAFGKVTGQLLKKMDYVSVLNSDRVLVNSHFTARRVKAIYGVQPLICYPPVDTSLFKPLDSTIVQKAHSRFGWPLILSTGRIVPIKRLEWLIKIMPNITKVYPSATLAIVGEASKENAKYIQSLSELAVSLGVKKM